MTWTWTILFLHHLRLHMLFWANPSSSHFGPTFPLTRGSLLLSDLPEIDSGLPGGEESTSTGASSFTFTSDGVCSVMSKATELAAGSWEWRRQWERDNEKFTLLSRDNIFVDYSTSKKGSGYLSHNPNNHTISLWNTTLTAIKHIETKIFVKSCCNSLFKLWWYTDKVHKAGISTSHIFDWIKTWGKKEGSKK